MDLRIFHKKKEKQTKILKFGLGLTPTHPCVKTKKKTEYKKVGYCCSVISIWEKRSSLNCHWIVSELQTVDKYENYAKQSCKNLFDGFVQHIAAHHFCLDFQVHLFENFLSPPKFPPPPSSFDMLFRQSLCITKLITQSLKYLLTLSLSAMSVTPRPLWWSPPCWPADWGYSGWAPLPQVARSH